MKTLMIAALVATGTATPALGQTMDGPRIELRGGWDNRVATVTYNNGTQSVSESDAFSGFGYGGEVGLTRW